MSKLKDLRDLQSLYDEGIISEEEFNEWRTRLMAEYGPVGNGASNYGNPTRPLGMSTRAYCTLMHLSQFANVLFPLGFVIPVLMWVFFKETNPAVDRHGRVIMNWMISSFLWMMVSGLLLIVGVGIIGLIALGICGVVFPIIGAVCAYDRRLWPYPLTITFFDEPHRGTAQA